MISMKITLAEKPQLIPSTPPLPATLDGSLQPSQAITAGAFAKTAPINVARNSRIPEKCAISPGRAIDKDRNPRGVREYWIGGVLGVLCCWSIGPLALCKLNHSGPGLDTEWYGSARSPIFIETRQKNAVSSVEAKSIKIQLLRSYGSARNKSPTSTRIF
jgi:hypothetical protein